SLLAPWCTAETARSARAGKQVNSMSKHRHLPHLSMLVGFLAMTASAVARQSNTATGPFNSPFNSPFSAAAGQVNTATSPFKTTAGQVNTPSGQIKTDKPG